ncbi:hypothetical protein [Streptomyces sp. NPDC050548]|uniref:hypothetical protein n=1 Tax=Streptomyces sp. NPDC050548 TaxID=3365629 RepID=UPI0037BA9C1F
MPVSVLLWVLEEDDPDLNPRVWLWLWRHISADSAMRRAIVRGVSFGAARTGPLPLPANLGP